MIIIQLGNKKQCDENGLPEWDYAFGIQTSKGKAFCSNPHYADAMYRKNTWNVQDEHRTNFKLVIVYDKKIQIKDWEIPF